MIYSEIDRDKTEGEGKGKPQRYRKMVIRKMRGKKQLL